MGGIKLRRAGLIGATLLVMVVALVYLALPKEPRYQGRTLTEWLKVYDTPIQPQHQGDPPITLPTQTMQFAMAGVRAIGTNAIPTLLGWLQAKDSPAKMKLNTFLDRQSFFHFRFKTVHDENRKACTAFLILGHEASAAVPKLIELTYSPDAELRRRALDSLIWIQPEKNVLFPLLLRLLKDPDPGVNGCAAFCLARDYPQEIEKDEALHNFVLKTLRPTRWWGALAALPPKE